MNQEDPRPSSARVKQKPTSHSAVIDGTIQMVHKQIRDINADGLVNCIDYATLFAVLHGDQARIIRNVNPETGMNHLFNSVDVSGKVWMVEPQETEWRMEKVWGSAYNPKYNRDRNDFIVIVAGYPDLTKNFLKSNPGLQSRFNARSVRNFFEKSIQRQANRLAGKAAFSDKELQTLAAGDFVYAKN
jgi:hypothetical protein